VSSLRSRPSFNHVGVCEEHWFANKDVCWAFVGRSPSSPTWSASRYTYKSNMKVEHGIFGITPKKCYMTGQNHVHSRFCVCVLCVCLCVLALSRGNYVFFSLGEMLFLPCSVALHNHVAAERLAQDGAQTTMATRLDVCTGQATINYWSTPKAQVVDNPI